jgi:23S rRNA A1618 N6-methylase RlmF
LDRLEEEVTRERFCCGTLGTGATAVYALLGAKKNKWKMTGTEVDEEYFQIATENVDRNGLSELVQSNLVQI